MWSLRSDVAARISSPRGRLTRTDRPIVGRPWQRLGGSPRSSTRCIPDRSLDANGDGVGDLAGLARRLDHLVWLGVDAVWMSPIFRSPMADYGYDVADYRDVDPLFGTVADLDHLLTELHGRGMRLLLDLVPNHTSSQHPWFVESRSSRANPKRDWYVWRDPAPGGGPPNNWRADFTGGPAWTLDPATGQYYLHCFLPEQPDLDWSNPEVEEAMHGVVRFWLDRGIDGFRIDVVHLIGKDPGPGRPSARASSVATRRAQRPRLDPRAPPSPPTPGRLLLR